MSYLLLGSVVGYGTHAIFGAAECGEPAFGMLRWETDSGYIHIHHWIVHLFILIIILIFTDTSGDLAQFFVGMTIGGVAQGLTYADRFDVYGTFDRPVVI